MFGFDLKRSIRFPRTVNQAKVNFVLRTASGAIHLQVPTPTVIPCLDVSAACELEVDPATTLRLGLPKNSLILVFWTCFWPFGDHSWSPSGLLGRRVMAERRTLDVPRKIPNWFLCSTIEGKPHLEKSSSLSEGTSE